LEKEAALATGEFTARVAFGSAGAKRSAFSDDERILIPEVTGITHDRVT
jgi:hypothetical protein